MKWTRNLPTEEGYYWRREIYLDGGTPIGDAEEEIVFVFDSKVHMNVNKMRYYNFGDNISSSLIEQYTDDFDIIVEWKGPLKPDEN